MLSSAPLTVLGVPTSKTYADVSSLFDSSQDAATILHMPVLTTFFNPSNIDGLNPGDDGVTLWNMGMVFHEGLHGFTGMSDTQLQTALGCATVDQFKTHNLTYYCKRSPCTVLLSVHESVKWTLRQMWDGDSKATVRRYG